ncbi:MAG: DUF3301 domain-containing protein [Gammaproteobacteria bacterium]
MQPLLLLIAIGALLWFWQQSLRAREIAARTAQDLCRRQDLQLLDGTVALNALRLRRSPQGHVTLHRTYQFDYSHDGEQRLRGFVLMLGLRVESAGLAAER